jgi:hypothetical protein
MRDREPQKAGVEHGAEFDKKSFTTHDLQSTSGPEVIVVDGRCVSTESPGAAVDLSNSDVFVALAGDPMTDLAGKVQWFEPFEIRRPKGVLEIAVRIVQGTVALYLSLAALAFVASCVRLVLGGQQGFQPDPVLRYIYGAISLLAILMVFVTARRFVYWKVDQAGIHQFWFGFKNWSLPWNEIVSRRLGPVASPAWLFLILVPIAGGPYQPIVLEDRQGRKRKVNRLGTNGDRLDAFLLQYLNPTGEAHQAQTYSNAIQRATAIHSSQDPAQAALHLCTRDSPVVRMKMYEPRLLSVCCNCLGPAAVRVSISMSPGLIGFFNDNFLRLSVPLCSACQARLRRRWPTPAKLVKVVRANPGGDWMDVRFGNPDYARLVQELNGMTPDSPMRS